MDNFVVVVVVVFCENTFVKMPKLFCKVFMLDNFVCLKKNEFETAKNYILNQK